MDVLQTTSVESHREYIITGYTYSPVSVYIYLVCTNEIM